MDAGVDLRNIVPGERSETIRPSLLVWRYCSVELVDRGCLVDRSILRAVISWICALPRPCRGRAENILGKCREEKKFNNLRDRTDKRSFREVSEIKLM